MDSLPDTRGPPRKARKRRRWKVFVRWRKRLRVARRMLMVAPSAVRIVVVAAAVVAVLVVANLLYHVVHKPTEMLFPVSGRLNKAPAETWRVYGPLFQKYSTGTITPELLAALAQIESAGNPVARTYWRWRLTWNPFAIYAPASSAVGMYQMTDPAFAEARRYCIRQHAVVEDGCWLASLYVGVLPRHAVELAAIYLDRGVAAVLAGLPAVAAKSQQKQDLAALIHLCGAGPAKNFARRGFRPLVGERCGDHAVAAYLAKVNAMKREFLRLAAER